MKRLAFTFAVTVAPIAANAQVPTTTAPTTLDPGGAGDQAPRRPATPAQPGGAGGQQTPNVIVVGPDGKITSNAPPEPGKKGYYANTGDPVGTYDEPGEVYTGTVPELHTVRQGDTLWDICFYYFNDPWQWPKIWSYNTQITNPHWIYPGDLVRLLPRGVFTSTDTTPQPDARTPVSPDVVPPPAKKTEVALKQVAFVEKADLEKSIVIDGSVDEKVLLGARDEVYVSYPENKKPDVGVTYSIYTPGNPVKSGGDVVGNYVRLLGTVRIDSVLKDKRARGTIVESYQEITRGAKVGPLVKTFKNVSPVAAKVNAQGAIVAQLKHDELIGEGEVVFVNLGKASGLEVGNRMYIVRRGDALPKEMDQKIGQDDRRFPARALGEVVIVDVGDKVSIGLVTISVQEMTPGDIVMMQKPNDPAQP